MPTVVMLVLVATALLAGCKSDDTTGETDGSQPMGASDGGDAQALAEGATIDEATTFQMFQFAELARTTWSRDSSWHGPF